MRRAIHALLVCALLLASADASLAGLPKSGASCSKVNQVQWVGKTKFTCTKSGKKSVWTISSSSKTSSNAPLAIEGGSCKKMGLQVKLADTTLECRKFANNLLKYIAVTSNYPSLENPGSIRPSTYCRISDMRTSIPDGTLAIAYPPTPFVNYRSSNKYKVVVVGIDFSDVPGKQSPAQIFQPDVDQATAWLKWFTHDKVKIDFQTYPQWFRAAKPSGAYAADSHASQAPTDTQAGGLTGQQIAEDYIAAIEGSADLSNTNAIWIYFPTNITKISGQWIQQIAHVQTKNYGVVTPHMIAVGADTYLSKRSRSAYFLHEMIHGFGLQGHSPKYLPANGFTRIGIMNMGDGWTTALLPWDAMTWGVDDPSDTFCLDKSDISGMEVKLVPLEREQLGFKSAMVKLNNHQVLIVESHRSDKWGPGEGVGFAGAMVTLIDTTISTSWDNNVTVNSPDTTSTGVYLKIDNPNHGTHVPAGIDLYNNGVHYGGVGVINGVGIAGDYNNWDLNHIMYPGDTVTNSGVKITLVQGGDNDTIKIEKV